MSGRKISLLRLSSRDRSNVPSTTFTRAPFRVLDDFLGFALAATSFGIDAWRLLGLGMTAAVLVFDIDTHGG